MKVCGGVGMRRAVVLGLVLGASGGACGDAGESSGSDSDSADALGADGVDGVDGVGDVGPDGGVADPFVVPSAVPIAELADAFGRARCAFDARCEVGFVGAEPEACIASAGAYAWMGEVVQRQVARGRSSYDAEAMGACLQWLAARPCGEVGQLNWDNGVDGGRSYFTRDVAPDWLREPSCRAAFLGDGEAGEGCMHGVECKTGTCFGADRGICGVCAASGATCAWGDACPADERCDQAAGRCVPRAERGEACGRDADCLPHLRCEGAPPGVGTCGSLPRVGEACDDGNFGSALCAVGARCRGSMCTDFEGAVLAGDGEACGSERACRPGLSCKDLVCVAAGVGDKCSYSHQTDSLLDKYDGCPPDLVCGANEKCAVAKAAGETCRDTRDCGRGLYCEGTRKVCEARLGEGAVCSAYPTGGECAYPLVCVGSRLFGTRDGTCQLGAKPGERCTGKEDCAADLTCTSSSPETCAFYGSSFLGCR